MSSMHGFSGASTRATCTRLNQNGNIDLPVHFGIIFLMG